MPLYEDTEEESCCEDPIHGEFGLSYASYLVWPRSVLQAMPHEWQSRLVQLGRELNEHFGETIDQVAYSVVARDSKTKRITSDPLAHYRHSQLEPDVPFIKR